jgi:hypothetical protein
MNWDNNKCGYCGFQDSEPLEKLTCAGEQAGVECCRKCGFSPKAPVELHLTKDYFIKKLNARING